MKLSCVQKREVRRLRRGRFIIYGALGVVCMAGISMMASSASAMGLPTFVVGVVFIVVCQKIGI